MQAIALDPLTSSVWTLKEIREMVTEMLDAEREWLPQFGDRRPRPTPTIPFRRTSSAPTCRSTRRSQSSPGSASWRSSGSGRLRLPCSD